MIKPNLTYYKFKPPDFDEGEREFRYQADVDRIVRVFRERSAVIDSTNARLAWEELSDSMCAGWLVLPKNDEDLFQELLPYLEEVEPKSF